MAFLTPDVLIHVLFRLTRLAFIAPTVAPGEPGMFIKLALRLALPTAGTAEFIRVIDRCRVVRCRDHVAEFLPLPCQDFGHARGRAFEDTAKEFAILRWHRSGAARDATICVMRHATPERIDPLIDKSMLSPLSIFRKKSQILSLMDYS
jgi:hypothetical protein